MDSKVYRTKEKEAERKNSENAEVVAEECATNEAAVEETVEETVNTPVS